MVLSQSLGYLWFKMKIFRENVESTGVDIVNMVRGMFEV